MCLRRARTQPARGPTSCLLCAGARGAAPRHPRRQGDRVSSVLQVSVPGSFRTSEVGRQTSDLKARAWLTSEVRRPTSGLLLHAGPNGLIAILLAVPKNGGGHPIATRLLGVDGHHSLLFHRQLFHCDL